MPKMRHLLRKFNLGGGGSASISDGVIEATTPLIDSTSSSGSTSSEAVSDPDSVAMRRIATVEPLGRDLNVDDGVDFNMMEEEEFQVRLAMAISASNPDAREDADTAQIDAVKRISLGCSAPVTDADSHAEFLSLRYWGHKVISYDEKVKDGFYDVYGLTSNALSYGKMPPLVDLRAISISDNVEYEIILVDRLADHELLEVEKRAYDVSLECLAFARGLVSCKLVQKLADIVVEKMGGPVVNADEMVRRWSIRSYELRNSLNTIVLPIGRLDIGLARHRALLFKVLSDRIDMPCKLVKGSYYTGTDDEAVNLIKLDDEREYIVDLMGAPGALIPTEVSSSCLPLPNASVYSDHDDILRHSCLVLKQDSEGAATSNIPNHNSESLTTVLVGDSLEKNQASDNFSHVGEKNQTERFEHDFARLMRSEHKAGENSRAVFGKPSTAQKNQVKDVSKCVITAAKNPEFAKKLYAVLLDSGASCSTDLFPDTNLKILGDQKILECIHEVSRMSSSLNRSLSDSFCTEQTTSQVSLRRRESSANIEACYAALYNIESHQQHTEADCFKDEKMQNRAFDVDNTGKLSDDETKDSFGEHGACSNHDQKGNPLPGKVAEWEISWEDLKIGERIGIGSYGEVYRADWNGSAVAVKKFLDQGFSGNVLAQFKSEIEIMLRLRHPNVVLFMGAVMRPPHCSILTEFLPRGSLYKLLHRPKSHLDEKKRVRMALDVAQGMNYLHTSYPTIVHRDLKSPNLLVDKNWVVKVCDLGLSRIKHNTFLSSKSSAGTPEWMAPEVLRNEPANEKCDVYSFGVILWELATSCVPWKGLNPMQVVGAVGFQNRRLDIPEYVDPAVAQIILECWLREPHLRPSFAQLMQRLKQIRHLTIQITNSTDLITL